MEQPLNVPYDHRWCWGCDLEDTMSISATSPHYYLGYGVDGMAECIHCAVLDRFQQDIGVCSCSPLLELKGLFAWEHNLRCSSLYSLLLVFFPFPLQTIWLSVVDTQRFSSSNDLCSLVFFVLGLGTFKSYGSVVFVRTVFVVP